MTTPDEQPPPPPDAVKPGRKFNRVSHNKHGRPTKITQPLIDSLVSFVRTGAYIETAAIASGISKQTFYNWLRAANDTKENLNKSIAKGDKLFLNLEERLLLSFLDSVERAQAEAEVADVITIKKASAENWQAAAWRLERKFPDKWGRRDMVKMEQSGPNGGPIETHTTDTSGIPAEEKDELLVRHYERIQRKRNESSPTGE